MEPQIVEAVKAQPNRFDTSEIVTAAGIDSNFYGHFYFPRTCKQDSPGFHLEIDDVLDRPENRYIGLEAFRGSAKTSKLRLFTSKRIAYGISRTILFISASESHSAKSVTWVANNVLNNKLWANSFQLSKGNKWTETDIEIYHGVLGITIRLIGLGITGQLRGINIEDYRPDLIVVDDPEDEENTATPDQRNKVSNLFDGAIRKSLVPVSENPDAKLIMLQTPLHKECLIESLMTDPMFVSRKYGCFDIHGESRWPQRFSTDELLLEKESHIARNKLSIWLREMECKLVDPETASFRSDWLKYYEMLPEGLTYFLAIDPAPLRSEQSLLKNIQTDYQAVVVIGIHGKEIYLAEYKAVRDQDPDELGAVIVQLIERYKPRAYGVETVAYQRNLKWHLEKVLKQHRIPPFVKEINDKRNKTVRIRQTISDRAYNGHIHVKKEHTQFITQFCDHPNLAHDDIIDAFSMALMLVGNALYFDEQDDWAAGSYVPLPEWRSAP